MCLQETDFNTNTREIFYSLCLEECEGKKYQIQSWKKSIFPSPAEEKARIQQLIKLYGQSVEYDEFGNIIPDSEQSNTDLHGDDHNKQQASEYSLATTSWPVSKETTAAEVSPSGSRVLNHQSGVGKG